MQAPKRLLAADTSAVVVVTGCTVVGLGAGDELLQAVESVARLDKAAQLVNKWLSQLQECHKSQHQGCMSDAR